MVESKSYTLFVSLNVGLLVGIGIFLRRSSLLRIGGFLPPNKTLLLLGPTALKNIKLHFFIMSAQSIIIFRTC